MPIQKKKPVNILEQSDAIKMVVAGKIDPSIATTIPKPFISLLRFVGAEDDNELQDQYLQIAGYGRPLDDMVASNLWETTIISEMLIGDLERFATTTALDMGVQVQRVNVARGSKVVIDTSTARKMCRRYASADGVSSIGAIRLCPIPDDLDPNGFAIAIDTVTLLFGSHARQTINKIRAKSISIGPKRSRRRSVKLSLNEPQWFDPNEDGAIRKGIELMMKPCFIDAPKAERQGRLIEPDGWASSRSRRLRSLLMLQALSMLPTTKQLFATGAGRHMLRAAIDQSEYAVKLACKGMRSLVDRDGVPHFWFDELRRLGLDSVSVPLIKLR